jgi:hypothetical protein
MFVSDCCYVESDVDHEICSRCGEHCSIIVDDILHSQMMNEFIGVEDCHSHSYGFGESGCSQRKTWP